MRVLLRGLVIALCVAGCSAPAPAPSASAPTPSTSSVRMTPSPSVTPTRRPPVSVRGADRTMLAVLTKIYAGRTGLVGTVTAGTWERERTAVVVVGRDVTLLVAPLGTQKWSVAGGWWPSLDRPTKLGAAPRFVAVLGVDARPPASFRGSRADSLQVTGVDGKGGGGILGVARDTWVTLPQGRKGKINSAWSSGGGRAQVTALRSLTGLPIEGYVATGFTGFVRAINGLGGLPISLPKAVRGVGTTLNVKAGRQVLTGKQALAYARERKALADGDFGRSRHQGDLLLAGMIKARLMGIGALPRILTIVSAESETNLSAAQVLTYAAQFYRLSPTRVGHGVMKGSTPMIGGQSVVVTDAASRRLAKAFRDGRL